MQQQPQQRPVETALVGRANQRKRRTIAGTPGVYEELTPAGTKSMVMFSMTLAPGESTADDLRHGGDEGFVLLAGNNYLVEVDGKKVTLEAARPRTDRSELGRKSGPIPLGLVAEVLDGHAGSSGSAEDSASSRPCKPDPTP